METRHSAFVRTTAAAIHDDTTLRYHWNNGNGLATVTEKTDKYIEFSGPECNGRFTHEQINTLIENGRLQIVIDSETHTQE